MRRVATGYFVRVVNKLPLLWMMSTHGVDTGSRVDTHAGFAGVENF